MKMTTEKNDSDDMLPEYDFKGGVRGKYAARFAETAPVFVELAPDVATAFPDANAVNEALRTLLRVLRTTTSKSATSS